MRKFLKQMNTKPHHIIYGDAAKAVLREKFIVLNIFIKKCLKCYLSLCSPSRYRFSEDQWKWKKSSNISLPFFMLSYRSSGPAEWYTHEDESPKQALHYSIGYWDSKTVLKKLSSTSVSSSVKCKDNHTFCIELLYYRMKWCMYNT